MLSVYKSIPQATIKKYLGTTSLEIRELMDNTHNVFCFFIALKFFQCPYGFAMSVCRSIHSQKFDWLDGYISVTRTIFFFLCLLCRII